VRTGNGAAFVGKTPDNQGLDMLEIVHGLKDRKKKTRKAPPTPLWDFGCTPAWKKVLAVMVAAGVKGSQATSKRLRHGFDVAAIQAGTQLNLLQRWARACSADYHRDLRECNRSRRAQYRREDVGLNHESAKQYPVDVANRNYSRDCDHCCISDPIFRERKLKYRFWTVVAFRTPPVRLWLFRSYRSSRRQSIFWCALCRHDRLKCSRITKSMDRRHSMDGPTVSIDASGKQHKAFRIVALCICIAAMSFGLIGLMQDIIA
jgi:hypothetical protein